MYGWIWRKIPGGLPGKIIGSLALAAGAFALLWFVAFPAVRPHMPWSNVDLDGGNGSVVNNEGGGDDDPAGDESTCTEGLDCPDDWKTATPPDDAESSKGDG